MFLPYKPTMDHLAAYYLQLLNAQSKLITEIPEQKMRYSIGKTSISGSPKAPKAQRSASPGIQNFK
jgi:hypothetical protein